MSECDDDNYDKEWLVDHWGKGVAYISSSYLVRELFIQDYLVREYLKNI